ncbi:hypothetical protein NEFER01_1406 [Nematocida sp. LUAm1]|nr:hypothetical protein NEFER02_2118 [Nematocida sp. LUAm2]KAI5178239.1 hypothetical protein NEFER01_1406 [Nematocida sp. LUAm1]
MHSWKTKFLITAMGVSFLYAIKYIEMKDQGNPARPSSASTINTKNNGNKPRHTMKDIDKTRFLSFFLSKANFFRILADGLFLFSIVITLGASVMYITNGNGKYTDLEKMGLDCTKTLNEVESYSFQPIVHRTPQPAINNSQMNTSSMKYIGKYSIAKIPNINFQAITEIITTPVATTTTKSIKTATKTTKENRRDGDDKDIRRTKDSKGGKRSKNKKEGRRNKKSKGTGRKKNSRSAERNNGGRRNKNNKASRNTKTDKAVPTEISTIRLLDLPLLEIQTFNPVPENYTFIQHLEQNHSLN